jgi:hypothetical protein
MLQMIDTGFSPWFVARTHGRQKEGAAQCYQSPAKLDSVRELAPRKYLVIKRRIIDWLYPFGYVTEKF